MINRAHDFRKVVTVYDREYGLMLLPTFSVSKPDAEGVSRMVFDWGKSISHPRAEIAFAILDNPYGQHIEYIVYKDCMYSLTRPTKCRSGRMATKIRKTGPVGFYAKRIIDTFLAAEFPTK